VLRAMHAYRGAIVGESAYIRNKFFTNNGNSNKNVNAKSATQLTRVRPWESDTLAAVGKKPLHHSDAIRKEVKFEVERVKTRVGDFLINCKRRICTRGNTSND